MVNSSSSKCVQLVGDLTKSTLMFMLYTTVVPPPLCPCLDTQLILWIFGVSSYNTVLSMLVSNHDSVNAKRSMLLSRMKSLMGSVLFFTDLGFRNVTDKLFSSLSTGVLLIRNKDVKFNVNVWDLLSFLAVSIVAIKVSKLTVPDWSINWIILPQFTPLPLLLKSYLPELITVRIGQWTFLPPFIPRRVRKVTFSTAACIDDYNLSMDDWLLI